MKALLCSNELLLTGAPLFLYELATSLTDIDITVYAPEDGPLKQKFLNHNIAVTHDLDITGFDIVLSNTLLMHEAVRLAVISNKPVIWMIHESDPTLHNVPTYTGKLLGHASQVVFPCCPTASVYEQFCSDNSSVIPAVIAPFEKKDRTACRAGLGLTDEFVILNVGTIEQRKGQRDLIKAVTGLDVKCLFVGRTAHTEELQNAPSNVRVVDATFDIHKFYAAADLYVCCSRVEAYPRSIMEAAVYGLPIITSPVFGIRELIHDGVHGFYYRYGRVEDLRNKIQKVMTDRPVFQPLNHIISFDEMINQYRELIHQILSCPV